MKEIGKTGFHIRRSKIPDNDGVASIHRVGEELSYISLESLGDGGGERMRAPGSRWLFWFSCIMAIGVLGCPLHAAASSERNHVESKYGGTLYRHKEGSDDGVLRMRVHRHWSPTAASKESWYGLVEELMYKLVLHAFTPRVARVGCCRVLKKDGVSCEHASSRVYVRQSDTSMLDNPSGWRHEAWCGFSYYLDMYHMIKEKAQRGTHDTALARIPLCQVSLPVYASEDVVLEIIPGGRIRGDWITVMLQLSKTSSSPSFIFAKNDVESTIALMDTVEAILSGNDIPTGGICIAQEVQAISVIRCGIFLFGFLLILFSREIASSTGCRLAGGSLTFVAMSGIVLAYIIWRQIPHRKSIMTMITLWSGAAFFIWRTLLVGSHDGEPALLPSILRSPLLIAYMAASGLVGMAVTYYFNDDKNEKLNTILKVGLQICGSLCMVMSPTSIEAGVLLAGIASAIIYAHHRHKHSVKQTRRPPQEIEIPNDFDEPKTPYWGKYGTTKSIDQNDTPTTPTVFRASTVSVPPSPKDFPDKSQLHRLVQRGKILNVDTDRTIAIGKGTYNALFLQGYEVDFEQGTITPPSSNTEKKRM